MRLRQSIWNLAICAGISLLLGSCVIAPIPLPQTEVQSLWSGRDAQGHDIAVEADQKNWYFPVLASPEGPTKLPTTTKCDYRYFLVQSGRKERTELTFLRLDGVEYTGWQIKALRGTPYLMAEMISGWGPEKLTTPPPKTVQVDIVVFEGKQLKHRRTLASIQWIGRGNGNPLWDRFTDKADGRYVVYKSSEGFRCYDVWNDTDEPMQPGQ